MNKLIFRLSLALIMTINFYLLGCSHSENFIDMTRDEIINKITEYPRFRIDNQNKIMICVNSSFKYYDSINELKNDSIVMNSKEWEIAFRKTFWGKQYIRIKFNDKNIVMEQQNGYLNDGP